MGAQASSTRTDDDDEQMVKAFIHERFIELFLSQNKRSQLSLMGAAVFIFITWSLSSTSPWILAWLISVLVFGLWRLRWSARILQGDNGRDAVAKAGGLMAGGGLLMALSVLGFGSMSDLGHAAVSIILLAMATGSVISTAGYRGVFRAYAAPMLISLALGWVASPHPAAEAAIHWGLSLLILIYLAFLVGVAKQQAAVFEDSCRIRFAEKKLNAQLQRALENESEAHRAKTHFLAAASHDLRQPIHSMNVLVAALSMRPLDERGQQITQLLASVNKTLAAQLDALLDISRLDAGTVEVAHRPLHLDRLVTEHFHLMENSARERGLRCTLQVDGPAPVRTDPGLLLRVISNLTDNAIKYNRQGGEVRLRVWREGAQACLSVADTGIGIAEAEQPKVFREFYQVDNVERDRTKGLGLGLSIVQRLSALLGLQVRLASTPGQGTEITLRMPLEAQADTPAAPAATPAPPDEGPAEQALSGLRVLVVDDDAQVRQSMELLLTEVGCRVYLATGTAQACEIARQHTLDVLLSDMRLLAGDDGLKVLHSVRALQPGLPAAMITGETGPEQLRLAQGAGVPLLHKPVHLDALRGVLPSGARLHWPASKAPAEPAA
ncbi:MAG: hybrid sensor histidine kinase/response regulator [Betaproteobacteria bacterium]